MMDIHERAGQIAGNIIDRWFAGLIIWETCRSLIYDIQEIEDREDK